MSHKKPDPKEVALAGAELRNLRDQQQIAQEKVREWQTRIKIDPALTGHDLEQLAADFALSEQAFLAYTLHAVNVARLRLGERQHLIDYARTQGRV